jgi:hypothetical protein
MLQASILELGPQIGDEDDDEIQADVLSQWMLTVDFERQPQVVQGVARAHLSAHRAREAQQVQMATQATSAIAEQTGQENAARPGGEKPEPSKPGMDKQKEGLT